nr:DBF4-type zinc finger-containing protein 2 [Pelodiscus sinensis]|eukprot:XP_014431984.1 DBF4-type zinc finger-containing protein 2 [Pelodiscus sinensis]
MVTGVGGQGLREARLQRPPLTRNRKWWRSVTSDPPVTRKGKGTATKMFDRSKPTDEASASSAQGTERRGIETSLQQESSSSAGIQVTEQAGPGLSNVQNRQGYCNCCHVHYSNLEQHVFSSQHRRFTMNCRNRTGTTSLMERFLQDVLQHHPHRYHDNRLAPSTHCVISADFDNYDLNPVHLTTNIR